MCNQYVRYILYLFISISMLQCQGNNEKILDSSFTYVLDTSLVGRRIGKVKTMPLVINISDNTIQFLRLENQPKSFDSHRNKYLYNDYRYVANDKKIKIEDSIYFSLSEISNDRIYLRTSSQNYAYRKVKNKASSNYFNDEIQSKNIEFYESKRKKIFLSPINHCSYNRRGKFWGIQEIEFIDSHEIIQSTEINSFYTNGLFLIKYGLFTMSVIEINSDSSFIATIQNGSGHLYNSKVESKSIEVLKDISLNLISEITNERSSRVIKYNDQNYDKGNVMMSVNESTLVSVEDDKFVVGLRSVENGINLTLDGVMIDHYFPLTISPTGKSYYTSNEKCNSLILEKVGDSKFSVSLDMTLYYGKDLENRSGWSQSAEFTPQDK